ncbi:MAG: hypothetical protein PUH50_03045 [Firmicutes bacterium]|jgi:uncharacterized membrane protein|nr:putative ABC transporter permease [Bacillota bacterium]MDD7284941.1 hypothetical protein [Bacillota bacterium]
MSERFFEITVFILGGMAYGLMEVLFRGHTHWSMVITGGACVLTLYLIMDWTMNLPLVVAALAGAGIITFYEFCVGMLVNVSFGWHVWDYSSMPGNILGQICPLFTGLWFAMCLVFFGLVRLFA